MPKIRRSTNFSKAEEHILLKLALMKKNIVENKKTDAITCRLKEAAWEQISRKFNSVSCEQFRGPKVLKDKYNNIKRNMRKAKIDEKKEKDVLFIGCGPSPKEQIDNPLLNELRDVIGLSVDGLQSRHDDDDDNIDNDEFDDDDDGEESEIDIKENFEIDEAECLADEDIEFFLNTALPDNEKPKEITPPPDWEKYHHTMLQNKPHQSPNTPKIDQKQKTEDLEIRNLKKKILAQQLHHAQLEHDQRMLHSKEEHRLKVKILEAELKMKETPMKCFE